MSGIKTFSAVNTKVRAMRVNMLNNDDYIALIESKNLEEIICYLKDKTSYGQVLEDINSYKDINILEVDLMSYSYYELSRLLEYFSGPYREFLEAFRLHYDLRIVKSLIRRLLNEGVDAYNLELMYKVKYLSNSDLNSMLNVKNLDEFIRNLSIQPIKKVLENIQTREEIDFLFNIEMSLDRFYFNYLREKALNLDKENRKIVLSSLEENVDLLNIEWIYRGIVFYRLNPDELINYTLDHGKEFDYNSIRNLCYSSPEDFKKKISKTKYGFIVESEHDIELYMKRRIDRYLFYNFFKKIASANFTIDTVLTFIHLLDFEYKDILAIVEATRYHLSFDEKKAYLVRRIKGSE